MALTVGSLFSGIGGLELGLERAGMETIWQVERDEFARSVLARHWPEVERHEDVFKVGAHNLTRPDLICGGDPCQANSNAKTHGRTAVSLGDEFLRVVAELRPRLVLRENPSVTRKDAPWPWHRFRSGLEYLGYAVLPFRLRACCAGADHRRERLFLLAELQDADRQGLEGDERQVMARADQGRQDPHPAGPDRWSAAPRVCGGAARIPHRMDRLRCLGNAVVPQLAERIGRMIVADYH